MTNISKKKPSVERSDGTSLQELQPGAPIDGPALPNEIEPDTPSELPENDPFDEGNFPI